MKTDDRIALVGMLVLLAFVVPLRGGFTDDGFIHIQYARNLIETGQYAFNRGEPSFGTTSPLWVMALAAVGRFFASPEALIVISRVLSWSAGLAAVAAFARLAARAGLALPVRAFAVVAFAADAWLGRWTALSMETSSAVLAACVVSLASLEALDDVRRAARLGAAIAVAALVRPEFYLAVPVWLAVAAWRRAPLRVVAAGLATCGALLLPWLAFARLVLGSFLPNTAGAKSGGLTLAPLEIARRVEPVARMLGATQLVSVAGLVLAAATRRGRRTFVDASRHWMLAWLVALPAAYVLLDIQVLSRYLLLVLPPLVVLGAAGWQAVAPAAPGRRRALVAALALAAVASNAVLYARVVLPPSRAFAEDLQTRMKGLALYLHDHAPPDAVVAAADIGYLAFYSQRRVLDLGGLVEPRTGALRERYDYETIVERGLFFGVEGYPHVDYLVDREPVSGRFDGRVVAGHRFERVHGVVVRNLGIRKPGPWYYDLYRIRPEASR